MMDPLNQFIIKPLFHMGLGGVDISLTNSSILMIASVLLVALFFMLSLRKSAIIPSVVQSMAELPFVMISAMLDETTGSAGVPFISFIMSIFLFVFMGNMLGMLPYSFTFTGQIIVNFALAFVILSVITFIGFVKHGFKFLRLFCPPGIPLWISPILIPVELISYFARTLSLSIRLFANMVAGHSMLKIFAYFTVTIGAFGILPFMVNMGLIAFEFLVSFIQAYVFAMLSCVYLNDALELH